MVSMTAFTTQLLSTHKNNKSMIKHQAIYLGCETIYFCRFLQISY